MKRSEAGTVLFLILIAVVLFAALSYVVTQSTRTNGGTISREKARLMGAQIQQIALGYKLAINRLYSVTNHRQVQLTFNNSDPNGVCYDGSTAINNCRTVGVFSKDGGMTFPNFPEEAFDNNFPDQTRYTWGSRRVYIDGADLGTPLNDEYIAIGLLKREICEDINKVLTGSTDIPLGSSSMTGSYAFNTATLNGTITGFSTGSTGADFRIEEGCTTSASGRMIYTFMVRVR